MRTIKKEKQLRLSRVSKIFLKSFSNRSREEIIKAANFIYNDIFNKKLKENHCKIENKEKVEGQLSRIALLMVVPELKKITLKSLK